MDVYVAGNAASSHKSLTADALAHASQAHTSLHALRLTGPQQASHPLFLVHYRLLELYLSVQVVAACWKLLLAFQGPASTRGGELQSCCPEAAGRSSLELAPSSKSVWPWSTAECSCTELSSEAEADSWDY